MSPNASIDKSFLFISNVLRTFVVFMLGNIKPIVLFMLCFVYV